MMGTSLVNSWLSPLSSRSARMRKQSRGSRRSKDDASVKFVVFKDDHANVIPTPRSSRISRENTRVVDSLASRIAHARQHASRSRLSTDLMCHATDPDTFQGDHRQFDAGPRGGAHKTTPTTGPSVEDLSIKFTTPPGLCLAKPSCLTRPGPMAIEPIGVTVYSQSSTALQHHADGICCESHGESSRRLSTQAATSTTIHVRKLRDGRHATQSNQRTHSSRSHTAHAISTALGDPGTIPWRELIHPLPANANRVNDDASLEQEGSSIHGASMFTWLGNLAPLSSGADGRDSHKSAPTF